MPIILWEKSRLPCTGWNDGLQGRTRWFACLVRAKIVDLDNLRHYALSSLPKFFRMHMGHLSNVSRMIVSELRDTRRHRKLWNKLKSAN